MGEWKEYRLGDLFERVTRKNSNLESQNVLTISAKYGLINQEEFFNKSVAGKNLKNYYLLKKGEFAYNKSYSFGYPMGATKMLEKYEEGIVSTLYICFKSKSDLVDNEYFKYYFESKQYYEELAKIVQEGARNHGLLNVSIEEFMNIRLKLPDLQEQKNIVNYLSRIDNIITKLDCKTLLEEVQRKDFLRNLIKENKNGVLRKIKDICKYQTSNISLKMTKEDGKYYLYDANEIIGKSNYYIPNDYITIIKDGAGVGRVRILKKNTNCISTMGIITAEQVELYYLYYLLQTINFQKYIVGTTIPHIYFKDYGNINIYLPDIEIQRKVIKILQITDRKIELLNRKKNKYEDIKKILMQKLLTGKVRVKI